MTYNALETSFEHRFSKGLFLVASYTFAKLISNTDGEDANRGDGAGQNQYNRAADKTVGIQDTPHNFALMYVYELPIGRGMRWLNQLHPVVNGFLGNWRISGVHKGWFLTMARQAKRRARLPPKPLKPVKNLVRLNRCFPPSAPPNCPTHLAQR